MGRRPTQKDFCMHAVRPIIRGKWEDNNVNREEGNGEGEEGNCWG